MRLGTLLLRDAVVSLGQLEAALHSQVLHGGRLGTHLVALGFLELDEVARYLGEMRGVPVATEQMFEAAPPEVLADFDADLAGRCEAFPLGYFAGEAAAASAVASGIASGVHAAERAGTLAVAMANPCDDSLVALLAQELGRPIAPHVAPELRIRAYQQRCYGLSPGRAGTLPGVAEAAAAMAEAGSRERVGDALIGFAASQFGAAVVFVLRRGEAVPWRVHGAAGAVPALSLSAPSVLQVAYERGSPARGRAPCMPRSIERALWAALGTEREPRDILVVPVLVGRRVVNLIYAHGVDGEGLDETAVGQIEELAGDAGSAYARMLQAGRS